MSRTMKPVVHDLSVSDPLSQENQSNGQSNPHVDILQFSFSSSLGDWQSHGIRLNSTSCYILKLSFKGPAPKHSEPFRSTFLTIFNNSSLEAHSTAYLRQQNHKPLPLTLSKTVDNCLFSLAILAVNQIIDNLKYEELSFYTFSILFACLYECLCTIPWKYPCHSLLLFNVSWYYNQTEMY